MIVAKEKLKSNIAEYILYMWQVEDIIRACNFDIKIIEKSIIAQMKLERLVAEETRIWYEDLAERMDQEGIKAKGHLGFVNQKIDELQLYHNKLIEDDQKYKELFNWAKSGIDDLALKSKMDNKSVIMICFTGLYGLLVLRLRKKVISEETSHAISLISNMIAYLTARYMKQSR